MNEQMDMYGNFGVFINEGTSYSFQVGSQASMPALDPDFQLPSSLLTLTEQPHWMSINGYHILSRGWNDLKCLEVASDIKKNRLLPRLITKQCDMLYGNGPAVYKMGLVDGKIKRVWQEVPEIKAWLDSWEDNGIVQGPNDFAKACIKNFYYFRDFFCKFRFSVGKGIIPGVLPIAGIEAMENNHCRLATLKKDVAYSLVTDRDFTAVAVGRFAYGISSSFSIYPKFKLNDVARYNFAAISHHREKSVNEFYGQNETHEGTREYIKGSNTIARYINSFLNNALAAKVHIIIPDAWVQSKRIQIQRLCEDNKRRNQKNLPLHQFAGIDIGTEFEEALVLQYISLKLREVTNFLSGADNQGKTYATYSFKSANGIEEWQFQTLDLKYKEYIESLIAYDKRADEVLLSSVGLDSSISSVSKDGVISKSGSDSYYNYLIYLMQLNPEDEICCEPFNWAIKVNFPHLYEQGYRIGFYREVPARQEELSLSNRLNNQQP